MAQQFSGDVIGVHDLGPGSKSPITGARPDFCMYCHEPHVALGGQLPLWNQKLTTQSYSLYNSTTEKNRGMQPIMGSDSNLCLSCHDGTIAPGTTVAFGKVTMTGSMYSYDIFGSNLQPSHPFALALPLKDNIDLIASLASKGKTGDPTGAVHLVKGNIECTSCHNAHVQAKDLISQNFLVRDSSSGQMCLACHDPTRQMAGQLNPLADWVTGAHSLAQNTISPQAGLEATPRCRRMRASPATLRTMPKGQPASFADPTSRTASHATMAARILVRQPPTSSPNTLLQRSDILSRLKRIRMTPPKPCG